MNSLNRCCLLTVKDVLGLRDEEEDYNEKDILFQKKKPYDEDNVDVETNVIAEAKRKQLLWDNRRLKPSDVAVHNTAEDCWLSWNGVVRDLTPVIARWKGSRTADVLLSEAGKDVTHWFDSNGNFRSVLSQRTGIRIPYLPRGEVPQTHTEDYPSGLCPEFHGTRWWKEDAYIVGYLTSNTRQIAITNTLAVTTAYITVCEEDTLELILMKYLMFNANAENYTWKYDGRKLDMTETLAGNDIPDYAKKFREIGLPEDTYIANIFLYYNDNI